MTNQEPLLDTEWLLGLPDAPGPWRLRFFFQSAIALILVLVGVSVWPALSKIWIHNQLAQQYQSSESEQSRNDAMISLAELLPQSLPVVMAGLSKANVDEAHLAYEALDYYIGRVIVLPNDQRRAVFAELIHAIEEAMPNLPNDSLLLARALASRVSAAQQSDQHPGSLLTLAACQRIDERTQPRTPASLVSNVKLSDSVDTIQPKPYSSAKASLSDMAENEPSANKDVPSQATTKIDNPLQTVHASLRSNDDYGVEPPTIETAMAVPPPSTPGQLREKLQRANRFTPVNGNITFTIQSGSNPPVEEHLPPIATPAPVASFANTSTTANRVVMIEEEVIGMSRQETIDLIRLLSSVQPRLASAAFHELQRTRLKPKELDIAVELSQGTTEQRLGTMERLVRDSDINPIMWLTWMAREADRDVRFKAVGLLGSLSSDDARRQLRLMHNLEQDPEISRHIQHALLASGSSQPRNR